MKSFNEHIVSLGNGKHRLLSHKGKNLGTFNSKAAAEKHEREVEYFKHMKEHEELNEARVPISSDEYQSLLKKHQASEKPHSHRYFDDEKGTKVHYVSSKSEHPAIEVHYKHRNDQSGSHEIKGHYKYVKEEVEDLNENKQVLDALKAAGVKYGGVVEQPISHRGVTSDRKHVLIHHISSEHGKAPENLSGTLRAHGVKGRHVASGVNHPEYGNHLIYQLDENEQLEEAKKDKPVHRIKLENGQWQHSTNGGFTWKNVTPDEAKAVHPARFKQISQDNIKPVNEAHGDKSAEFIRNHPAVYDYDEYKHDGHRENFVTLKGGYQWSGQHGFGVSSHGEAKQLLKGVTKCDCERCRNFDKHNRPVNEMSIQKLKSYADVARQDYRSKVDTDRSKSIKRAQNVAKADRLIDTKQLNAPPVVSCNDNMKEEVGAAPTNVVGTGNIAGANQDPPGGNPKKIIRRLTRKVVT